jgi:uncharacterized damage-inducible protein DinB
MDAPELLTELHGRVRPLVEEAVEGLTPEQLTWAPSPDANTIAWLIWHLTRVQDLYFSEYIGDSQTLPTFADRFGRSDADASGYGDTAEQMQAVRPESAEVLVEYHAAVQGRMLSYLRGLSATDLDRVVDDSYDPPVTLGARLVSIAEDCLQHVGQANYLRGLLPR